MPKLFGLLPDRNELRDLSAIVGRYRRKLIDKLLEITPLEYTLTRQTNIMQEFRTLTNKLHDAVYQWENKNIKNTFLESRNIGVKLLKDYGLESLPGYTEEKIKSDWQNRIDQADAYFRNSFYSMEIVANRYFYILRKVSESLMRVEELAGLADADAEELLDMIENMAVSGGYKGAGASRNKIAKSVEQYIRSKIGGGNLIEINGRMYDVKKHSMLIARTELRKTQTAGIKSANNEFGNDLVEISDHGTTTEICKPYEGRVFSVSGGDPDYPYLDIDPPFHPNCMHYATPTTKRIIEHRAAR